MITQTPFYVFLKGNRYDARRFQTALPIWEQARKGSFEQVVREQCASTIGTLRRKVRNRLQTVSDSIRWFPDVSAQVRQPVLHKLLKDYLIYYIILVIIALT